jgi:hypothetical protein
LIGETGIAMDLLHKAAFVTTSKLQSMARHTLLALLHPARAHLILFNTTAPDTTTAAAAATTDTAAAATTKDASAAAKDDATAATTPHAAQTWTTPENTKSGDSSSLAGSYDPWFGLDPLSFGDWTMHIHALDNIIRALDNTLVSFTLWNYTPQNNNARGDGWNDEDLSLWSPDQLKQLPPGGGAPTSAAGSGRSAGGDGDGASDASGDEGFGELGRHINDPYAGGRALPAAVRNFKQRKEGEREGGREREREGERSLKRKV